MTRSGWIQSPRRLLVLFLGTGVLLVCSLLWLAWQLARQDKELAGQRLQEQRENAADWSVAVLSRALSDVEEHLVDLAAAPAAGVDQGAARFAAALPDDAVLVVLRGARFDAYPARRLPYYPDAKPFSPPPNPSLDRAADFELRAKDYPAAIGLLDRVARGPDRWARATALLRLARIRRNRGEYREALAAYHELSAMGDAPVEADGLPSNLVAAQARLGVFARRPDREAARKDAETIIDGLQRRRWRLTRGVYEFYAADALQVLGRPGALPDAPAVVALAAAAGALQGPAHAAGTRSRTFIRESGIPLLVLRHSGPERDVALLLGPGWVNGPLTTATGRTRVDQDTTVTLTDAQGVIVAGPPLPDARLQSVRLTVATGLPWNVHAASFNRPAALDSSRNRQRLLVTGFGAITGLLLAGIGLVGRAVSRELAASRLQSDFVSAVSHEFRTPLSSLCLLSEMLEAERVGSEADRADYYAVLSRESRRLRRLVEGLLNFGRMEAGAMQYRFETIDPADLASQVVREFQRDVESRDYVVDAAVHDDTPLVQADRSALSCALWNLLDNAVKYSPGCRTVWVEVGPNDGGAVISVRDRGIGIPLAEHGRIFEKFVRGGAATKAGIVGTGVGLALVRHIASAHGGRVTVESAPGSGSTFTIELPPG
jgi:signal transduction histidine kinase